MKPILLQLSGGLVMLFAMINAIAMAFGNQQPHNRLLAGFHDGCVEEAQPCWYGIVPGTTRVREAQTILAAHGYSVLMIPRRTTGELRTTSWDGNCRISLLIDHRSVSTIYAIQFSRCGGLRLGDAMGSFGAPVMFDSCTTFSYTPTILFDDGYQATLSTIPRATLKSTTVSPYSPIRMLSLSTTSFTFANPLAWRGFSRLWRYCQVAD